MTPDTDEDLDRFIKDTRRERIAPGGGVNQLGESVFVTAIDVGPRTPPTPHDRTAAHVRLEATPAAALTCRTVERHLGVTPLTRAT